MEAESPAPAPAPEPVAPPAEPVLTALESAVVAHDFPKFQDAKRAEAKGEPLAPPPVETKAEDPDAEPAPAPDRPLSRRQQQINDYERRIAEQNERIARLEGQVQGVAKPDPKAAPAPPTDPEPKFEDFAAEADPYTAHLKAVARWEARQELKAESAKAVERQQREQAEASQREIATAWKARVDAAITKHPDFIDVALKAPTAIKPGSVVDGWILESPHGAEVLYHLQVNRAEQARILALPPYQQLRALVALEDSLTTPAPKTISSAPEPPPTLGTRVVDPGDPLQKAVETGDFRSFQAAKRAAVAAARR